MGSRREILVHGAVIAAGILSAGLPGMTALAQTAPPTRRSLEGLAWNDPIVATLRDGIGLMKQMHETEKFSWPALASIHGNDPETYHFCPHGDWYLLPWHRAYLVMYERIIRRLTHNEDWAFPFWDWTTTPTIPAVFSSPTTPDGKTNWLYNADQGWKRTWPATKPMPPEIVGPDVLTTILSSTSYEEFGTSKSPRQNSLDPSWVSRGGGVQGVLESRPHNLVHNNIGGWMPTASSPRDPIFFMHHANIDRIWTVWNLRNANSSDPMWTDMVFSDNFWNADGSSWSPKVFDLTEPEQLGYGYGLTGFAIASAAAPPRVLELRNRLSAILAGAASPTGQAGAPVTVSMENDKAATATRPLEISLAVPGDILQTVRRQPPLGSGVSTMNFAAVQERAATSPRALAFLRDVMVTDARTTLFRVFVDGEGISPSTPISDPHYVGTFGVFNHGAHGTHEAPSFVFDLTPTLRRLGPDASGTSTNQVRLVLVPTTETQGTVGTATPSRVEVAIVNT